MSVIDYATSANNSVGGIDIATGCNPGNVDNALRKIVDDIGEGLANGYFATALPSTKAAGYTVLTSDRGKIFNCTAALTLTLPVAATAGAGFMFHVKANGGRVTIDPNAAELVDGAATVTIASESNAFVVCTGTAWVTAFVPANVTGLVDAAHYGISVSPTDERTDIASMLSAETAVSFRNSYLTSAGAANANYAISDPDPSAFVMTTAKRIDGLGKGVITLSAGLKSIFQFAGPVDVNVDGAVVKDITLLQPRHADIGASGLSDDYSAIRFEAAKNSRAENITFTECDVALTFQFSQTVAGYADRSSKTNYSNNVRSLKTGFMGLQLFGEQGGIHTNHNLYGLAIDDTSRAVASGVRLTGFSFASVKNNVVTGHIVNHFANGLTLQSYATDNTVSLTAIDCANGAQVVRQTTAAECQTGNAVTLITIGGNYGLYDDGGSYNVFDINATGFATRGILATNGGAISGLALGNTYRGTIQAPAAGSTVRLAQIENTNSRVDLKLKGTGSTGTDTGFGLLCTGTGLSGIVDVSDCQIGVQLSSGADNANLSVKASACSTALLVASAANNIVADISGNVTISGNTNVISGNITGNLTVSGNDNTIIGYVSGTITNSGTGNHFMACKRAGGMFSTSGTTDASGLLTISHGLAGTPSFVVASETTNNGWYAKVTSRTPTQITFRVWSDNAAPVASSSVGIHYVASL